MKNKITLVFALLAASSLATAEIVINELLSFEGFVDMSYWHEDNDFDGSDNCYGLDQVEINWLFNFEQVCGVIDFAYYGSDSSESAVNRGDDTQLEQAYVTYSFDDGTALTAGRFQSMIGFEAFEPTGLYQKSFAYSYGILPGYAEGVKYIYEGGDAFFGVALLNSYNGDASMNPAHDRTGRLGGAGDSDYVIEAAGSYVFDDLTLFLGGYYQDADDSSTPATVDGSTYAINAYVTFETGVWLFACEVNFGNSESGAFNQDTDDDGIDNFTGADVDAMSALIMANYAYSDVASITGRVSYESLDYSTNGNRDTEVSILKYTLAHGYAFTDNFFLITEVSFVEEEVDLAGLASADGDGLEAAVKLIFAF